MNRLKELYKEAIKHLVSGVNSPVRAFKAVGGEPIFLDHASGAKLYDVDGKEYIDFMGSWGPLILGHAHPEVVEAIKSQAERGTSFGVSTELEIEHAKLIKDAFPSIELVRFVNSGTEATMSAVRLARGYTSRSKIVKFAGCYHGHADFFLVQAGSGVMTLGIPGSKGVTDSIVKDTLVAQYNDLSSVEKLFEEYKDDIAAVIVEPVAGNMGVVLPDEGFLEGLRKITEDNGALLIFDEVITGFRVGWGGYQTKIGVTPDLTTLGKIIGGGLPVGAYGGKREIMEHLAPLGPVYQAGTLSGNPLAMSAGIATLKILKNNPWIYEKIDKLAEKLTSGVKNILKDVVVNRVGSMFTPFFTKEKVFDYNSAMKANAEIYGKFYWKMLEGGAFPPPSQFEAWFISAAHTEEDIDKALEIVERAARELNL